MRVIIQRVSSASVTIGEKEKSSIEKGLLVLVGFESTDCEEDIEWMVKKTANLRIFDDTNGVMNESLVDIGGDVLVVSQFTLHARTRKGNRPSYVDAAGPEIAIPLYRRFIEILEKSLSKRVKTGEFGANMQVKLVNDGPVTISIDSKKRE
jgi:D-tyrosyl-tRNA(Tyr) deacylase